MKIILVIPYNPLKEVSGLELIAIRLSAQFQLEGNSTIILTKGQSGRWDDIEIIGFENLGSICKWLLRNHNRYDIIQWMEIFPETREVYQQYLYSLILTLLYHKKVLLMIATSENMRNRGGGRFWKFLAKISFVAFVVYNESQVVELEDCGFSKNRIHLLSSGIDTQRIFYPASHNEKTSLRIEHNWSLNKCLVLYIGRFVDRKRPDFLLDLWERMPDIHNKAVLLLIGSGMGHTESIEDYVVNKAKNVPSVCCIPSVFDTWNYYRAVDIVVIPSIREGEPVVLLEAMACALPVVASQIPGTIQLINHEQTGILCDPNDANAFKQAIRYLICHPDRREVIGGAARKKVCSSRDIRMVADRYLSLYRDLIGG